MSARMKKYRTELKLIGKCNKDTQKSLFKHANEDFIRAIVDAVWTTLDKKVPLRPKQKAKILKQEECLRKIADRGRTIEQKRRLLCRQEGGNAAIDLINIVNEHFWSYEKTGAGTRSAISGSKRLRVDKKLERYHAGDKSSRTTRNG